MRMLFGLAAAAAIVAAGTAQAATEMRCSHQLPTVGLLWRGVVKED